MKGAGAVIRPPRLLAVVVLAAFALPVIVLGAFVPGLRLEDDIRKLDYRDRSTARFAEQFESRWFGEQEGRLVIASGTYRRYDVVADVFSSLDTNGAIELYRRTRERCRQAGVLPYELALCDLDEAEIDLELNLTGEGDRLAHRAHAAFEDLGMVYEAGKALVLRAVAASQAGRAGDALELFADARARFVEQANPVRPALIDLYRALILHREGRHSEAEELAVEKAVSTASDICTMKRYGLRLVNRKRISGSVRKK